MKLSYVILFIILSTFVISFSNAFSNTPPVGFVFERSDAELYLEYSYASYCLEPDIQIWNCTTCRHHQLEGFNIIAAVYNLSTDTQAYVGFKGNEVIIAFRGSIDVESWITNGQFLEINYPIFPSARVHSGFYYGWESVREQIKNSIEFALQLCGENCTRVMVTGHSLGAALATLAVAEIQGWTTLPTYMYNFGSPRVGDHVFAQYFNKVQPNTYRVVYENDIVPAVPPEGLLLDYHHVPTEIFYSTNSTYRECNDSGEDPHCDPYAYSIYDHLHYFGMPCCCK